MANGRSENGVFVLLGGLAIVILTLLIIHIKPGPKQASQIPAPIEEGAKPSATLDINVYIDGSGSIKHFLPPATASLAQTNYVEGLLQKCESSLLNVPGTGVWKGNQVRFWKFGKGDPKQIKSGELRDMSHDMSLYFEGDTQIEKPIKHEDPTDGSDPRPELKIIMTDLYQSNGHLNDPAIDLATKYLGNDTGAVGVLAVRNPFAGTIEDFPGVPRSRTLPANTADSMPFYIIFAGPAGDVRHAMDALIAGVGLGDALQRGLATKFVFTRAPEPRGQETMTFTGPYTMVDKNYNHTHIPLVDLKKGVLQVQWTDTRDGILQHPGDGEELTPSVSEVGADKALHDAANPDAVQKCGNGVFLCEKIDRSKLKKGTTYVFRFDRIQAHAPEPLTANSEVLQRWNIEIPKAEQMKDAKFPSTKGLGGHPGLTPDLSEFLAALQGQMFHDRVPVTFYYLYVQAH